MSENTKEPWVVEYMGSDESDVVGANGVSIICGSTGYMSDVDARRIVACVNACAGIETEVFEAKESEYQDLATLIDGLIAQRDEARRAMKESDDMLQAVIEQCADAECEVIELREKMRRAEVPARHPTVVKWRNNGISACAEIADAYGADYVARDIRALLTKEPK